jgi:hypothetical protein
MSFCDKIRRFFVQSMSRMHRDAAKAVVDVRPKKMRNSDGVRGERSSVAGTGDFVRAAGSGLAIPEPKAKKDLTGRRE